MRLKVPFFRYLLVIAGFLLPSVIFAALLPSLINAEPVKVRLMAELRDWTGADVAVSGPISVDNFFSLSVDLRDVAFTNMKAGPGITSVKAERLVARIAWYDLLFGNLDFDKIKIYDAALQTRAANAEQLGAALLAAVSKSQDHPFAAFALKDSTLKLGGPSGPERTLLINSLTANLRKTDGYIELSGRFGWEGETLNFRLNTNLRQLAARTMPVPLNLTMDSRLASIGFNGQTSMAAPWSASGYVALASTDLPRLADWLRLGLKGAIPSGLQLTGTMQASPNQVSLESAAFAVGDQKASGELTLKLKEQGARLEGALALDNVDFAPLWEASFGAPEGTPDGAASLPAMLRTMDMDLRISAEHIAWQRMSAGPAAFTLTAHAGRFSADLAELGLFGGSVLGHLEADLARQPGSARARLAAEDLDMAQFSELAGHGPLVTGKADARFEVEAEGRGIDGLLQTARGRARISFVEGGSIPLNIAVLASLPPVQTANGWNGRGVAETAFDDLLLKLSLENGELRCEELTMESGGETIRGGGSVNLARQELDWRFTVSKALAGQAPRERRAGSDGSPSPEASLSIQGPWLRPVIRSGERSGALPSPALGKAGTAMTATFPVSR